MTETQPKVDLTNCDKEPIHIPGAVQPHGLLLVLDVTSNTIIQWSANAPACSKLSDAQLAGSHLQSLILSDEAETIIHHLAMTGNEGRHRYLRDVSLRSDPGTKWSAVIHVWKSLAFIELEPDRSDHAESVRLQASLRAIVNDLDTCESLLTFSQSAAEHFRKLTGFDRVMIYRFLSDESGVVIAEDREPDMDSYMDLRYPASDIPAQARALYISNPFRLTADIHAQPVPLMPLLNPKTHEPLDMSYCAIRATSPIHLEYLNNMGVTASLSFSVVHEGRLWGLVACHHRKARVLAQEVRISGEILARLVGLQVGIKEEAEHRNYVTTLHKVRSALHAQLIQSGNFSAGLLEGNTNLLSGLDAAGVALYTGTRLFTLGECPSKPDIEQLCEWMSNKAWRPVYATDKLSAEFEHAANYADVASGVLAVRIADGSPEAVLWFRPEVVRTVNWAGNPNKPAEAEDTKGARLHPRRSFALWKEQVSCESLPWQAAELEHAETLQKTLAQALLQHRAQEILRLNSELLQKNKELDQFASIASHDLQEPLRTITTYTQLFLRRYVAPAGPDGEELGRFITSATRRMSDLIDSLLAFARSGRRGSSTPISGRTAVDLALKSLETRIAESGATIKVGSLPEVVADLDQIARVFQNLVANSIKYSRPQVQPEIYIDACREGRRIAFSVRDNGTGFDPLYAQQIFQTFERLHGRQYEGSGLGLAICKRIVESFNGRIWAESTPNVGSVFTFTLEAA